MAILTAAAQTQATLRARLQARGFDAATAAATTQSLAERGYLDDGAYTAALVDRRVRRGRGMAAIAAELRARGLSEETIAAALQGVDRERVTAAALTVARRLLAPGRGRTSPSDLRRVAAALHRRGHDQHTIGAVLHQLGTGMVPPPRESEGA